MFKAEAAIKIQGVFVVQKIHMIQGWKDFCRETAKRKQSEGGKGVYRTFDHRRFKRELEAVVMDEYYKKLESWQQSQQRKTVR